MVRRVKTQSAAGDALHDTWQLQNDSPLPVQITAAKVWGVAEGLDPEEPIDLPWDGIAGVWLRLDDFTAEFGRADWQRPWNEVRVEPGDTLTAHVDTNTSLRLLYRRAGWAGILERRSIEIHGGI